MFGKLFKSKREVDEMPVAVKTSSALPNLATMLILSMTTYIEQNQAIAGEIISPKTFFIACPKQFLKNPDIKIQKKPVDPAVYQLTPYGVLVHTIWGEEAEDEAFRKFMELNNIIAHS